MTTTNIEAAHYIVNSFKPLLWREANQSNKKELSRDIS